MHHTVDGDCHDSVKLGRDKGMGVHNSTRAVTVRLSAALSATVFLLTGCAASHPQASYRQFFLPPQRGQAPEPVQQAFADPPRLDLYANEYPTLKAGPAPIPRPSDTEFLIQRANDRFAAGRRALQQGRPDEARQEFNRAIEALLNAPENLPDRPALERRLEELVDAIYRIDQDQLGASAPEHQG